MSNKTSGGSTQTYKSKFNPLKYGKVWGSIRFEHIWNRVPMGDAKGEVIGKVCIGGKEVELTFTECNRIIEVLNDAKHVHNVGKRLGHQG